MDRLDTKNPENGFFEQQDLFTAKGPKHYRIPCIAVAQNGITLAFANRRMDTSADSAAEVHLVMRRSLNGGRTWQPVRDLFAEKGWNAAIGTVIRDTNNDTIVLPYHRRRRNISSKLSKQKEALEGGNFLVTSKDSGCSWIHQRMTIEPNWAGCCGSTHGASPGITLQHGQKIDRLIAPARFATKPDEELATLQNHHYNCTIYSDDHGETWHTGGAVQVGTGEGCIAELSDGTIYYNSRAYFMDGRRRIARSYDGGETFEDFAVDETLIEPEGGCSAGMAGYPGNSLKGDDIVIFSNPASLQRKKLTVHLSYDGGKTWPVSKVIHEGPAAYSSMAVSPDGIAFVLFENGEKNPYEKISLARFNLQWLTN
jgi:sialidase-1